MSVPVNQRSHGKLEACVKAHALCCYTLRITSNKKVFTPDFQAALTDKIDETVLNMYTLCWTANNINALWGCQNECICQKPSEFARQGDA